MISLLKGTTAIGFYSVAYTLSEASPLFRACFLPPYFPFCRRLHQASTTSFRDMCARRRRYLLYLALPMAFFVTLWAKPLVPLLFGVAYGPSVESLQILIWAAAVMYVTMLLGSTFVAANLQRLNMRLTLLAIAVNVGLNVLLIPTVQLHWRIICDSGDGSHRTPSRSCYIATTRLRYWILENERAGLFWLVRHCGDFSINVPQKRSTRVNYSY